MFAKQMTIYLIALILIVISNLLHIWIVLRLKRAGREVSLVMSSEIFRYHRQYAAYAIESGVSLVPIFAYYMALGAFLLIFLFLLVNSILRFPLH
jgi:hypothetical protein